MLVFRGPKGKRAQYTLLYFCISVSRVGGGGKVICLQSILNRARVQEHTAILTDLEETSLAQNTQTDLRLHPVRGSMSIPQAHGEKRTQWLNINDRIPPNTTAMFVNGDFGMFTTCRKRWMTSASCVTSNVSDEGKGGFGENTRKLIKDFCRAYQLCLFFAGRENTKHPADCRSVNFQKVITRTKHKYSYCDKQAILSI